MLQYCWGCDSIAGAVTVLLGRDSDGGICGSNRGI